MSKEITFTQAGEHGNCVISPENGQASPAPVSELCACMMGPNDPDPKCTVCGGTGNPNLAPWQVAVSLAAGAMSEHGMPVACPWDGDLDDLEAERFNALVAAINAYLTVCPSRTALTGGSNG